MNGRSTALSTTTPSASAATLYLVPRAIDRLDAGRRLAAPLLGGSETDVALARRGAHPDLIELVPAEKKERIGIDQVREVIRVAQFSAVRAKRKVCMIPRAEALTPEAANALLKTLEEPPRDLAFVVLAEHPNDLLPTIVSRCRAIRVPPPARRDRIRRLLEAGHNEAQAAWLVRIAFRDGDLDRLIDAPERAAANRDAAREQLERAPVTDLLAAALDDEPIRRSEALLGCVERIAAQDAETLTVGVRVLAAQDRDVLARFLHELLATCFELVRAPLDPAGDDGRSAAARDRVGVSRLGRLCRDLDGAHRAIAAYGPAEAVLLSLMLAPEEDADAR